MKNLFFVSIFVFLASLSYAGTLGDINNDSKIDLSEAVYALQVTAGMRTQLGGQYFGNVNSFSLDAADADLSADTLTLFNVRIESDEISLGDAVSIGLKFNKINNSFLIESVGIFENIGVYNDWHFAKDVTYGVTMYKGSMQFDMGNANNIISEGEEFYMDLEMGQVISFYTDNANNDFTLRVKDPDGMEVYSLVRSANQGAITQPIPALKPGKYTVQFIPFLSNSVSLSFRFLNANRQAIEDVGNGDYIASTFNKNIRDYAKYKVYLNIDDLLTLQKPSNSLISIKIVDSKSKRVAYGNGLGVKYLAESAGYYYVFIWNNRGWGGSYGSAVIVTPEN